MLTQNKNNKIIFKLRLASLYYILFYYFFIILRKILI